MCVRTGRRYNLRTVGSGLRAREGKEGRKSEREGMERKGRRDEPETPRQIANTRIKHRISEEIRSSGNKLAFEVPSMDASWYCGTRRD